MRTRLLLSVLIAVACGTEGGPVRDSVVVELPPPDLKGSVTVEKCLAERRSVREFSKQPLELKEVSQLLWSAYGITAPMPDIPFLNGGLRTAPSAGGLYPLELRLAAGNVTGLPPGIYRYRSDRHELLLEKTGDTRMALARAALGQTMIADAPATVVYSAVFSRNMKKYGERGRQRYVCMDLGHSAENVYLQCVSLGLGTCAVGAFDDGEFSKVVGLPPEEEPLYLMPVGRPAIRE